MKHTSSETVVSTHIIYIIFEVHEYWTQFIIKNTSELRQAFNKMTTKKYLTGSFISIVCCLCCGYLVIIHILDCFVLSHLLKLVT